MADTQTLPEAQPTPGAAVGADHWERGETEGTQQVFPEPQGQPGPAAAAELARTDGQLWPPVRSGPTEAAAVAVPRLVVVGLRCMVEVGVETM